MRYVELGKIIVPARARRAGNMDYPVLSMTMRNGLVNQADKFKKRIASADTSPYKVVERNQLVVGFPIDEGVLAFQNLYDEAIVSPAYNIWNLQEAALVDSKYLEAFLRSPLALAFYKSRLRSTTARRRSLPNDMFLSLPVPLPLLIEQERIVKLLDEADELRRLRAKADQRSAKLVSALFHEMFGDPFSNPKQYPTHTLEQVCSRITDGTHQPPQFSEDGIPFLFVRNIVNGSIDFKTEKFISEVTFAELTRRVRPERGDILYSTVGSYGVAVMVETDRRFAFQRHIGHLKPNSERVDSRFLTAQLNTPSLKLQADQRARGIAQKTVNLAEIRQFKVLVPSLPLQREFAERISDIRELETAQAASRNRLSDLFQSLLHRAFNGQL